jgi:hypothetical protein
MDHTYWTTRIEPHVLEAVLHKGHGKAVQRLVIQQVDSALRLPCVVKFTLVQSSKALTTVLLLLLVHQQMKAGLTQYPNEPDWADAAAASMDFMVRC